MVDTFDCARAQIYHNTGKLTPAQIKAKTGCTHIINGYLFNGKFQPVGYIEVAQWLDLLDANQNSPRPQSAIRVAVSEATTW